MGSTARRPSSRSWRTACSGIPPQAGLQPSPVLQGVVRRAALAAFWQAGIDNGGADDGAPGIRAVYHADYYAAFLMDPSGNRIGAVCHLKEGD